MRIGIIEDNLVVNIIEGEPDVVAELFEQAVPETEATNVAWIGARFNGEKFEARKQFDSWTWNEETFEYDPPKPKPEGDYRWNEKLGDWEPIEEPEAEA